MSDNVWMCMPDSNSRNIRGFWSGLFDDEVPNKFFANEGQIMTKILAGQHMASDELPTKFYHCQKQKFKKSLPQIFHSSYIFINEKAADVLRAHDMGRGGLYPITLFENDKVTEIPANICILNCGNAKGTVILEKSKQIEVYGLEEGVYRPSLPKPEDDEVVVTSTCLEGPDIWVDPKMWFGFFVSDRLGRALIKAKLKNAFVMRRCTVG